MNYCPMFLILGFHRKLSMEWVFASQETLTKLDPGQPWIHQLNYVLVKLSSIFPINRYLERVVHYFTINFGAINFGDNIFGGINFGEISTIHQISIEIRSLENFRLGTSSPKLFHTEIYCK